MENKPIPTASLSGIRLKKRSDNYLECTDGDKIGNPQNPHTQVLT